MGEINFLGNKNIVSYNKWVKSEKYRKYLSKELGLNFNDSGYSKMLFHGHGSSFDGVVEDARNLKVLERWYPYLEHPLFKRVLENKKITELSKQIFGEIIG